MHFRPQKVQWFYVWAIISSTLLAKGNGLVPETKQLIASDLSKPADEQFNKMAIYKIGVKKRRSPEAQPVSLDGLTSRLKENHLWQEGPHLKRQTQQARREFKCHQQDSDIVTCFGDGRFYQFAGSLDSLDAASLSGIDGGQKSKKKRFIFKSWRNKGGKNQRDTISEDKKAESVPKSCYGFLAQKVTPQKLYKSNVGKPSGGNLEIDLRESDEPNINTASKAKEPNDQTATGHKEKRMAGMNRRARPKKLRKRMSRRLAARRRVRSKQMSGLVGCSTEASCPTTKSCTTTCPTTTCSTTCSTTTCSTTCPTTKRTTTCTTTCPTTKSCTTTCPTTTKPCRTTTCPTTPTCSTFCWSKCPPYEFTEQPLSTVTCSARCPPNPTCASCGQTSPCPCDKTATKRGGRLRKPSKVMRRSRKRSARIASTQLESPMARRFVKRLH